MGHDEYIFHITLTSAKRRCLESPWTPVYPFSPSALLSWKKLFPLLSPFYSFPRPGDFVKYDAVQQLRLSNDRFDVCFVRRSCREIETPLPRLLISWRCNGAPNASMDADMYRWMHLDPWELGRRACRLRYHYEMLLLSPSFSLFLPTVLTRLRERERTIHLRSDRSEMQSFLIRCRV